MARVEGMEALRAKLAAISTAARQGMAEAINAGADELVETAKAACPTDETLESHPGELRESIHKNDGAHELQVRVVADAQDAKGHYYGAHVELGHRTPDGGAVPAKPFFYPSWRLVKRRVKARIARAITRAAKGEVAGGG